MPALHHRADDLSRASGAAVWFSRHAGQCLLSMYEVGCCIKCEVTAMISATFQDAKGEHGESPASPHFTCSCAGKSDGPLRIQHSLYGMRSLRSLRSLEREKSTRDDCSLPIVPRGSRKNALARGSHVLAESLEKQRAARQPLHQR